MNDDNQNKIIQQLIKTVEGSQRNERLMLAGAIFNGLIAFSTMIVLLRELFKQKKPSLAERMRHQDYIIARAQLRKKDLQREAEHEAQLHQLKSNWEVEEKLQDKAEEVIKSETDKIKENLTNKFKDQAQGFTDKFKIFDGLKEKGFSNPFQKPPEESKESKKEKEKKE